MAVVRSNYIRTRSHAKKNIRYIQHRAGKDGQRITREMFDFTCNITRIEAYEMIDRAKRGTYFYRMSFNPHEKREDTRSDLDLKQLTRETIRTLEKQVGFKIEFAAAIHADHKDRRHVNLLCLFPRRLNKREVNFMRLTLTSEAQVQRRELDAGLSREWAYHKHLSQTIRYRLQKRFPGLYRSRRLGLGRGVGLRDREHKKVYACHVCREQNCLLHKKKGLELSLDYED